MIYQIFHQPELLAQCEANKHNRPLAVGAAALACQDPGILTDAAGTDQINALNPLLNEWTGMYWVWRHLDELPDRDSWIGFSHYRRPAPRFIRTHGSVVDAMLGDVDLLSWYPNGSIIEQQAEAGGHRGLFPTIWTTMEAAFGGTETERVRASAAAPGLHPFANCFVMTRQRFLHYAEWTWRILQPLVMIAGTTGHVYPEYPLNTPRQLGYLSERLLPVYCMAHRLRVSYCMQQQYR